jgi:general secretion pathway protein A
MIASAFYQELYGLKARPFALTPDPVFLYPSASHEEALDLLTYGLREGLGFSVLTGEVGTGKTTLVHALLARLPDSVKSAYVLNPVLVFPEILATILEDLGVRPTGMRKAELLSQFNRFLLAEHAGGHEILVVIDEAHNLTVPLLEELRMLSNLETNKAKLVHFLLVGQPELDTLIDLPQLRQLKQRVGVRVRLRPLNARETGEYIQHRLGAAGAAADCRFTPSAAGLVFSYSNGVPRLINQICHAALVSGYAAGARSITDAIVQRGWRELVSHHAPLTPPGGRRRVKRRWAARAAEALLVVLTAALVAGIVLTLLVRL